MSDVDQIAPPASPRAKAEPISPETGLTRPSEARFGIGSLLFLALLLSVPFVQDYWSMGHIQVDRVSTLGRFLCFAIVALSLDLLWGYTGILCLCQSLFFALGGYAMGMYLAMHGPMDADGTVPRCLFVVTSAVQGFKLPWFWKPFNYLWAAIPLGLLIPGAFAFIVGWFGFASRVRGVYFSILTIAVTRPPGWSSA